MTEESLTSTEDHDVNQKTDEHANNFSSVPYNSNWVTITGEILNIDWKTKNVADVGSGSGLSTFDLAEHASFVVGIESEDVIRNLAIEYAEKRGIKNVEFVKGLPHKTSLNSNSMDVVIGFASPIDYKESTRIIKRDGVIISITVLPKLYSEGLDSITIGKKRNSEAEREAYKNLVDLNFKHKEFYQIQEYGSPQNVIETYWSLFDEKAIEHIKNHNKTSIKWKWIVYYKKV